jgi:hypothetical protein
MPETGCLVNRTTEQIASIAAAKDEALKVGVSVDL